MPEGHTLYALARDLDAAFRGTSPVVTSPQGKFAAGAALLSGHEVLGATSRGKHLFVEFAGERWLWVHLGLIGTFRIDNIAYAGEVPVVGQVRCRFATEEHVADLRGPMVCDVVTPEKVGSILDRLGPDPLRPNDVRSDPDLAWKRIQRSSKPIAELLMDQEVLAGVGNVYRSEVLFRLRVNPFRPGNKLQRKYWRAMWDEFVTLLPLGVATSKIVTVHDQVEAIAEAMEAGDDVTLTERDSYVYRRAGEACLVCGSRIRTQIVAGRNLFWCGNCQRRG
ncbi:Fpg/Nei family DNA glycosylase [Knoellia subterranea]|uniref:DNA-(apurinic or apyrimidinic site) lyase n=1 Tax=Knoellia subterranea KCTC 19937 TaxID=1385521 RepID=A0A0A0JLM5_9MICO|nr:DNA-formamidopyrimidine glycosylase family protein [Knoellia subterranea]KGN37669.1 DNA glycosylase [Knoellia subterranea KCTC 19937]